jgi:hypothetical protein
VATETVATVSAGDLALASGATYRQVDYWTTRRILRPVEWVEGSGNRRRYPPVEVDVARAVATLAGVGVAGELLHVAARAVRSGAGVASGIGWHVAYSPERDTVTVWAHLPRRRGR